MLVIYRDEQALNDAAREHCYQESAQVAREIYSNGQFLATAPLYSTSTATSVRSTPWVSMSRALLRGGQLRREIEIQPWGSGMPPCHKVAEDF